MDEERIWERLCEAIRLDDCRRLKGELGKLYRESKDRQHLFYCLNTKCWDLDNGHDHQFTRERCDKMLKIVYEFYLKVKEEFDDLSFYSGWYCLYD